MKALFKSEDELRIQQHVNAENASHFDELVHYSSFPSTGILTRSINPHAENIDPHSGAAYVGLSMQCAAGLANAKVGKRKSRVSRKVPIKVFSADTTNFMAMVHKLTGFQSSAYGLPGSPQTSSLKPLAARPLHPFFQGLYMPDSPAGDKMTTNFLNDSFSWSLSQRNSPFSGRQQLDSINDVSLSTKESFNALHSPSSANRFLPYSQNPGFDALHSQVLRNSNSLGPSSGVAFLPGQGDPMKDDSRKDESFTDSYNVQRLLHEDTSAVSH